MLKTFVICYNCTYQSRGKRQMAAVPGTVQYNTVHVAGCVARLSKC